MKRHAIKFLSKWLTGKRRKPLIVRGARQVGKSTLVRHFAQERGMGLSEVNLEKHFYLDEIFQTLDIKKIIRELEVHSLHPIKGNSILFLDEIQACPHVLPALRYFYEERPDIPVICAGSLLEFLLSEHSVSMPVGRVQYYHLGPMTFTEFVAALGENSLVSYLNTNYFEEEIPLSARKKLLEYQRLFLYVGGMPEAVLAYTEAENFNEVRSVHRSIVQTYQDDFAKYAKKVHWLRLAKIFQKMPQIVSKKVKYSNISKEDRSKNIKTALDIMIKARLLIPVYHSNCSGLPLGADIKDNIYKLYFLDVGLLNYLCNLNWQAISNMDSNELINEGVLAEQFTAQHLYYREQGLEAPNLNYWLREAKSSNAEVDFVLQWERNIIPVEVKAGKSGSLKSLLKFAHEKKTKHALRFDLNIPETQKVSHYIKLKEKSEKVELQLTSLPLYLVENIIISTI